MNLISNESQFVFAGNAVFTVKNEETGNRFTFKVKKHDEKSLYFVCVLTGNCNLNDFTFIGTVFEDGKYKHSAKSRITEEAQSVKAFKWYLARLQANSMPVNVHTYHEGRCGRCGRRLTVPESIESGFGPECINYL